MFNSKGLETMSLHLQWFDNSETWDTVRLDRYEYNDIGRMILFMPNDERRYVWEYNDNDKLVRAAYEVVLWGDWMIMYEWLYDYDQNNNLTWEYYDDYTTAVSPEEHHYTYDNLNRRITATRYDYSVSGTPWILLKDTFIYNSQNQIIEQHVSAFEANGWVSRNERFVYAYEADGQLSEKVRQFRNTVNTQWYNDSKEYILYNQDNQAIEINNGVLWPTFNGCGYCQYFSISAFPNLETLTLSEGGRFVTEMNDLPLRFIWGRNIVEIPDDIQPFPNVEAFFLTYRGLTELPKNLTKLVDLEGLTLEFFDELVKLPEDFSSLDKLTYLNIKESVTDIPASMNQMHNLKELYFQGNNVKTGVPSSWETMDSLTNLEILNLGLSPNSQKNIFEAPNLKKLNLQDCAMNRLEPEIGNLTTLEELNIRFLDNSSVRIATLPAELGDLVNLKSLSITAGNFEELPSSFGNLANLETLVIGAELKEIGSFIGNMTGLKTLELGNNNLESLPEEIKLLKDSLEKLYLYNNNFNAAAQQQIRDWLPNTEVSF